MAYYASSTSNYLTITFTGIAGPPQNQQVWLRGAEWTTLHPDYWMDEGL